MHIFRSQCLKLEINDRKKFGKPPNAWRLKNILLKNEWVNQAIKEKIKKYMETNENENTTVQILWDAEFYIYLSGPSDPMYHSRPLFLY